MNAPDVLADMLQWQQKEQQQQEEQEDKAGSKNKEKKSSSSNPSNNNDKSTIDPRSSVTDLDEAKEGVNRRKQYR